MSENNDYPTDEFGRPDGRDYHYRIPLNDKIAMSILRMKKQHSERHIVDQCHDQPLGYVCCKTNDSKGPISGLESYQHSEQWERPFTKGERADWEVRYAQHGGTKIKGTITAFNRCGGKVTVPFDTVVDMTLSEVKAAANGSLEELNELADEMHWVRRDAIEEHRERVHEAQQECDHAHFVEDASAHYDSPRAIGYCEDCGAELSENDEIVGGRTM